MKIQLETDRIQLREIELSDVPEVLRLHNHPEVQKYLGEEYPKDEMFIRDIVNTIWKEEYRTIGHGRWAVIEKETGSFMGWAGLKYIEEEDFCDLGYRLFPEFWGKGYATEFSFALRDCAFDRFKMEELWGMAWFLNEASKRVLEKIGMEFVVRKPWDKLSNDVMWYCMTKERYRQIKGKENE